MAIDAGTVKSTLVADDTLTKVIEGLVASITKLETEFEQLAKKTKRDSDTLTKSYQRVSADLDPVVKRTQKYEHAAEVLSRQLKEGKISQERYNQQLDLAKSKYLEASTSASKYNSTLNRIGAAAAGFFTADLAIRGVESLFRFIQSAGREAIEAEQSLAQLRAGVLSTGGAAGLSAERLEYMAGKLSDLTGIDDEVIAGAEAILLTFRRVNKEAFEPTVKLALDMSTRLGTDLNSAILQLGKALEDPIKGLTALGRAGVQFTDAQKKQIAELVKANKLLEAQKIILAELEVQFGGSAVAARDTMGGALQALSTSLGNLKETIGESGAGISSVIEKLIKLVDTFALGWQVLSIGVDLAVASISRALGTLAGITDSTMVSIVSLFATAVSINPLAPEQEKIKAQILLLETQNNAARRQQEYAERAARFQASAYATLAKMAGIFPDINSKLGQTVVLSKQLSDSQKKALDSVNDTVASLIRQAQLSGRLYEAALKGEAAYEAEIVNQKVEEAILKESVKLRKEGLQLSKAQATAIEVAIRASEGFKKNTEEVRNLHKEIQSILLETDKIILKQFEINKTGLRAMEDGAKRVVNAFKDLKSLDAAFEFELDLTSISDSRLRDLEAQYVDFLSSLGFKTIEEAEKVLNNLGYTIEEIKNRISEINDQAGIRQLQESGKTRAQRYKEEIEEIKRLEKAGLANTRLSAEQRLLITKGAQNEISAKTEAFWIDQVSGWSSALGFLGDSFGGFFARLSQYAGQLQQGYNAFASLGSAGSGAGWFGVFVAIVDIAHGLLEAHKENQRNRQWTLSANAAGVRDQYGLGDWRVNAAQDAHLNVSKASRDASKAINDAMEEIAEALGGVLKTFEDITINIRRDGKYFQALVGQEIIGVFESFEAAMEAALQASLLAADTIITGLSELVQEGLYQLRSGAIGRSSDLDQIVDFLSALKEISELGLPQGVIQMQEFTRHMDELWRQLQKINQITPAVAQGFTNLLQAEVSAWEAWSRQIRGVEQTQQELLAERKREAELFNAQKKLRIAELKLLIEELKIKAAGVQARGRLVQIDAGLINTEITIGGTYLKAKGELVKADANITQQYIDFINQVIGAINEVIAALEAIPDINVGDIKVPRVAGGGGRNEVRDFISDRRYDISTRGMTDFQRALANLDRTYAPMIEKAGRDKKLREELLALKEKEIQLLEQEHAKSTVEQFRTFLGLVTPFDQVRQTAEQLIKDIEGSTFGDARKAAMIGRVVEDLDRQIEELSKREAVSLFSEMIGRMEALGATDAQLAESRRNLAILEHTLALDNYRTRLEALRAEGRLAPEVINAFEGAILWLEGQTERIINGGVIDDGRRFRGYDDNVIDGANRFGDALKKATDLLNKYKEDGLDPLTRDLVQITKDFKEIRAALGDTPDVMLTYSRAVKNAIDNFLSPFKNIQRDLIFGADSPIDIGSQWTRIQADLAEAVGRYRAGDLTVAPELQDLIPEFVRIGRLFTPLGSQGFFNDVYSPIEGLLDEVLGLTIDDLGSINNPMTVGGIDDLTVLSEQQLDILNSIYLAHVRTAEGIDNLNANLVYNPAYQRVA